MVITVSGCPLWFYYCVVCPLTYGIWLCCLSFDLRYLVALSVLGQTTQWKNQRGQADTVNQRTDNIMVKPKRATRYRKSKDRQRNQNYVVCPLIYGICLSPLVFPLCCLSFDLRYLVVWSVL
jgi:hypothetical protein